MAKVKKFGQTVHHMSVIGGMDLHMERVHFITQMEIIMKGNLFKIKLTALENIAIKMGKLILAIGKMICNQLMVEKS
jgi:hypothetical protein